MRGSRPAAGLIALVAVLVAGCSGSGSGSAGSSTSGSSSSAGNPPASVVRATSASWADTASADEILDKARAALLAASSVHVKGALSKDGAGYGLDLRLKKGAGARGSVVSQGSRIGLLRIGSTVYLTPDAAFWKQATGSASAARTFAGKSLKVPSGNAGALQPFVALTDVGQLFGTSLAPAGAVTKGEITTVAGHRAIVLHVQGGDAGDVYVAVDGTPYPLRLSYGKRKPQHVDLDGYGAKVDLKAPPASRVVPVPVG
jgi:hypothetical protein